MAPWTLALFLDRLSGRPSFSPSPIIGASVLALPNPSSGLHLPELAPPPTLETWIHRRLRCYRHRRRRPTGPAPSSRRQLRWAFSPFISAAASPSTPQTGLISPSRTLPAPSTTNFYGLLRLQQRPYRPRKLHRHRFALGVPQHLHSRPNIAFYHTIGLHQRSYHILRGYHDATVSGLERLRSF